MSQYQTLLREQAQFYEGSPNLNNNTIYPSPDRYRQNSIGLSFPLENGAQNLLLKEAAKGLQETNINTLNSLNYNSKVINNQKIWDELNYVSDMSYSQALICPSYLTQEPVNIDIQQKSLITDGNITPISPNHNKLLMNRGLVGNLSSNELPENSNFITDINSQSFKENIEAIQQSNFINNFNNNGLSLTTSSLSFTDLKAINNGELNLVTGINNAELMAANTLLRPKINSSKTPSLTDANLIPPSNYTTTINQDNIFSSITGTPDSTPKMATSAIYTQNAGKFNRTFISPALSPAINQVHPLNTLNSHEKSMSTYTKAFKYEKMSTMRRNTVPPLIKTSSIDKKLNEFPSYISVANLKEMTPLSIKTDFMNKNEELLLTSNMEIDQNNMIKEDEKQSNENNKKDNVKPKETETHMNKTISINTSVLEDQSVGTNPLIVTPISASPIDLFVNEVSLDDIKQEIPVIENKEEEEKEEVIEKEENIKDKKSKSKDSKVEIEKIEIEKSSIDFKGKNKEEKIESTITDKKSTVNNNKVAKEVINNKNESNKGKTTKATLKKDEYKKKDKKKKENSQSETITKEKLKNNKKDKVSGKDRITKKDTESLKKNKDLKETVSLSVKTSPTIKKKPRFSLKKVKNDPAAIKEHILLKRKRNTEAARRSRQRKAEQLSNLKETVAKLTEEL